LFCFVLFPDSFGFGKPLIGAAPAAAAAADEAGRDKGFLLRVMETKRKGEKKGRLV
jgi:hypothetical protein